MTRAFAGPRAVALGDLDGDGWLDVIAANSSASDVSVFRGLGGGSFGGSLNYLVGAAGAVAVGDLDGDGRPDIAALGGDAQNAVTVLRNTSH